MRLRCHILKHAGRGEPLGISKDHDEVILTTEADAPDEINGTPVVKLVKRNIGGVYLHIEPVKPVPSGHVGHMMGGCFVMGSTSMGFPSKYPIPLHDRIESHELYKSMD